MGGFLKETKKMLMMVITTPYLSTMICNNIKNLIGDKKNLHKKQEWNLSFKPILKNKAQSNFYLNNIDQVKKVTLMMVMKIPFHNMTICTNTKNSIGVLKVSNLLMVFHKEKERTNMMVIPLLFLNMMTCINTKSLTGVLKVLDPLTVYEDVFRIQFI